MRGSWILLIIFIIYTPATADAQSYLSKAINVRAENKKLYEVLDIISRQGGFYFSYNSSIIRADSIISVNIWNKPVREALDEIFKSRFVYKETGQHVIIQNPNSGQYWYVSGYVVDEQTGERMGDVSVFESSQLVASLTNDQGYFKLKLKEKFPATSINISRSFYQDTMISIMPGVNQEVQVKIKPDLVKLGEVTISGNENRVENTWFGKMFLSSTQKIQSINLNKFFVDMPFQGSVVPGLSSQGKMVAQTSNIVSVNVLGGYTAGVNGVEVASLFNINKKDVRYVQAAGLFNVVGGDVEGVQLGGLHNTVMGRVSGVQAAGISNTIREPIEGVQMGGIYNLASDKITGLQAAGIANSSIDTVIGVQAAGIVNSAIKYVDGAQFAGITNVSVKEVDGIQVAGIFNYANSLKGVQVGLFNFAKQIDGVPIGLFSFVWNGYHKVSLSGNEMMPYNIAVKTGTRWLYNIYTAGIQMQQNNRAYRLGFGYGSDLPIGGNFTLSPELTGNIVYLGNWTEINPMIRVEANLNFRLHKMVAVYAGPSFTAYWDNKQPKVSGYATEVLPAGYRTTSHSYNLSSWIGWTAGVTIF